MVGDTLENISSIAVEGLWHISVGANFLGVLVKTKFELKESGSVSEDMSGFSFLVLSTVLESPAVFGSPAVLESSAVIKSSAVFESSALFESSAVFLIASMTLTA